MNLGIRGLRLALLTIDQLHCFNASIIALFSEFPSKVNVRAGSDKQTLSISQQNRFVSGFWAKSADESDSNFYHKILRLSECSVTQSVGDPNSHAVSMPQEVLLPLLHSALHSHIFAFLHDIELSCSTSPQRNRWVRPFVNKQIARPLELSTTDKIAEANTLTNYQWEAIFYR